MKEALQRDFDAESAQKSNKTKKEPEQNKNVYEKWMKLDTMEIVRDIGDRVRLCSAAGQDVVDNVQNIEKELKQSLEDHYDTVEPQIEKYKKYGQEMRDMNRLFVVEFDKVLDGKATDSVKSASESAQKQINTKIDHGQKIQDILESNIGFQAKMNAFKQIQNEFDSKKQKFVQQIGDKMDDLQDAVLSMEAKLNIMSTYYDDMISDHDKFINFVITQGDNYGEEMKNIREHLMKIGDEIKGKKRDLYEGQAEDVERKTFSADYEVYTEHNTTDKVQGGSSMDHGVATGIGMVVGAVVGGGIAAAATCGVGTISGAAFGGAVGGMIVGALIDKYGIDDKYEKTTDCTKQTATVTLTGTDYYDGNEQNRALQKILSAMKGEFKKYIEKLERAQNNAKEQKNEAQDFKVMIGGMKNQMKGFKEAIKEIKDSLKNAVIDEAFKKKMNNKQLLLLMQIKRMSMELKDKSKVKSKWNDDDDEKDQ